jgi:hypothetical protein
MPTVLEFVHQYVVRSHLPEQPNELRRATPEIGCARRAGFHRCWGCDGSFPHLFKMIVLYVSRNSMDVTAQACGRRECVPPWRRRPAAFAARRSNCTAVAKHICKGKESLKFQVQAEKSCRPSCIRCCKKRPPSAWSELAAASPGRKEASRLAGARLCRADVHTGHLVLSRAPLEQLACGWVRGASRECWVWVWGGCVGERAVGGGQAASPGSWACAVLLTGWGSCP